MRPSKNFDSPMKSAKIALLCYDFEQFTIV